MKENFREIQVNRDLKLWKYCVSHSQLVLLGQKDKKNRTRVVYLFKAVHEIQIPTLFFCKKLFWDENSDTKDIIFIGKDSEYRIVCEYVYFDEDELEFDDESPLIDRSFFP